jgi:surface protein
MKEMRKMFARLCAVLLVGVVALSATPIAVSAAHFAPAPDATVVQTGAVGADGPSWRFYSDGTVVVESGFIEWNGNCEIFTEVIGMEGKFGHMSPWTWLELDGSHVYTIVFTGPITLSGNISGLFSQLPNLVTIEGLNGFDTSEVTQMTMMFFRAESLESLDLSSFDVRDFTGGMWDMFLGAWNLQYVTLGENFDFQRNMLHGEDRWGEVLGHWRNVGPGTIDNPQGDFVFSAQELMENYDGSTMADTWVFQRLNQEEPSPEELPATQEFSQEEPSPAELPVTSDIDILINGVPLEMDVPPIVLHGRTLVPLRAIVEALGAEVEWLHGEVVISLPDGTVIFTEIGNDLIVVHRPDNTYDFFFVDVPPLLYQDRTMLPVRILAEIAGFEVDWDNDTRSVIITTQ